uniref:Uncharacterized protein n=1 Tax=Anguilla anguilla TaxID=7936 RepID=A0A0E9UHB7_ANGAN
MRKEKIYILMQRNINISYINLSTAVAVSFLLLLNPEGPR